MNAPFFINDELRKLYLRYIATELPLKSKKLLNERKALFAQDGVINREPLIEMLPRYKYTHTMAEAVEELNLNPVFDSFADCGLFSSEFKMYEHQYEALKSICCDKKNMVITTGTGSGKTEAFLFPLLHNIIEESKHWKKGKTPAIRGLLLYPLNALAEDQMVRLRKSLDSIGVGGAREWFKENLKGEKITFGRYTGKTPVSGNPSSNKKKDLRDERINLERTFRSIENHKDQNLRYNFPSVDKNSSEIFDRWTMQDTPPDLLITNYSMLNVMLMRALEASMFDDTKEWLANDPWFTDDNIKKPTRIFHLVVDELHTYRGTSGTEVAYLIKLLLSRLGISANSPQFRFLASSASLPSGDKLENYISDFTGVSITDKNSFEERFAVIKDVKEVVAKSYSQNPFVKYENIFAEFRNDYLENEDKAITKLLKKCEYSFSIEPEIALGKFLKATHFYSYYKNTQIEQKNALTWLELSEILFSKIVDSRDAVEGVLIAFSKARDSDKLPLISFRSHMFFRNTYGLWVCSNPACTEVKEDNKYCDRKIGKLYSSPKLFCNCGGRVLDLLVCTHCGDILIGGYRSKPKSKNEEYVVHDQPNLESVPQTGVNIHNKKYDQYTVMWNGTTQPDSWDKNKQGWRHTSFSPSKGIKSLNADKNIYEYFSKVSNEYKSAVPLVCPSCEAKGGGKGFSPLRLHSTAVQKLNQIMGDALIQFLPKQNQKLIIFTDSRQDSAKLSAGIEIDHYRDLVRQLFINVAKCGVESENVALKKYHNEYLTQKEKDDFAIWKKENRSISYFPHILKRKITDFTNHILHYFNKLQLVIFWYFLVFRNFFHNLFRFYYFGFKNDIFFRDLFSTVFSLLSRNFLHFLSSSSNSFLNFLTNLYDAVRV